MFLRWKNYLPIHEYKIYRIRFFFTKRQILRKENFKVYFLMA